MLEQRDQNVLVDGGIPLHDLTGSCHGCKSPSPTEKSTVRDCEVCGVLRLCGIEEEQYRMFQELKERSASSVLNEKRKVAAPATKQTHAFVLGFDVLTHVQLRRLGKLQRNERYNTFEANRADKRCADKKKFAYRIASHEISWSC